MTAFILNITFDCRDPSRLARFWAAATGYEPDPTSTDDRVRLVRPDDRGVQHLLFRRVPDPTPGKTRVHVDLAARDPDQEIERLLAAGASLVDPAPEGAPTWREGDAKRWVVLCDPEGNEFCLG